MATVQANGNVRVGKVSRAVLDLTPEEALAITIGRQPIPLVPAGAAADGD